MPPQEDDEQPRGWAPLDPSEQGSDAPAAWRGPAPPAAPGAPGRFDHLPPPPRQWPPAPQPAWGPPAGQPGWGAPVRMTAGSARTGPLPLHPMSLSDILDGAFKLLKAEAKTILLIVAAITLPLQLLSAFATRETFDVGLLNVINDPTVAESVNRSSNARTLAQLLTIVLSLIVTPFIAGAVSRVVAASYLGESISVAGALRVALRRSGALLAAFILVHLLIGVGLVFCILPGIALSAMFTLVAPAIAIEEIGPVRAMRRSWRLVSRRFWPVLGIALLAGFIANVFSQILGAIPVLAATFVGGQFAWVVAAVGGTLGELVAAPIVAIVATLLYFDSRIRQEGFDLQIMAADIGAR